MRIAPSWREGLTTFKTSMLNDRAGLLTGTRVGVLWVVIGLIAGLSVGNDLASAAYAESPPAPSFIQLASHARHLAAMDLEGDVLDGDELDGNELDGNVNVDDDLGDHDFSDPLDDSDGSFKIVTQGVLERGESLGASLSEQGVSAAAIHRITTEMRPIFNFRHSRPGDAYQLEQALDGRVLEFRYSQKSDESYYVRWDGLAYTVGKDVPELHAQVAKIAGVVDSSFYGAVVALGEQSALASEFARILAWDIDFSRNVHSGDEFSILYERLYQTNEDGEDVYVRPGRVLAGRYSGKSGRHTVVYFEDEKGGAYFRPDGTSIERAFLAAPLEFSRISSRFTRARHHPILNVTRPHPGIDYAAPHGTPVYAVANGVVEFKARAGASGNLIRVRHRGGYTSHYAHLARFKDGLKVGDRVKQRQVIGYVGSTGLSTGPHVCFRVKKDGRYVDPMKISGPAGTPVAVEQLDQFVSVRDQFLSHLGPGPVNLADEAL